MHASHCPIAFIRKQYNNHSFPQNLNVMFDTHLKHQKQSEDSEEDHLLGHVGCACCPPGIWRGTERGTVQWLGFMRLKDLDTCVHMRAAATSCPVLCRASMTQNEHVHWFCGLLFVTFYLVETLWLNYSQLKQRFILEIQARKQGLYFFYRKIKWSHNLSSVFWETHSCCSLEVYWLALAVYD